MLYTAGEKFVFSGGGMKNAFANLVQTNVNMRKARNICMRIAFYFDLQLVTIVASEVEVRPKLSQYIDRKKKKNKPPVV